MEQASRISAAGLPTQRSAMLPDMFTTTCDLPGTVGTGSGAASMRAKAIKSVLANALQVSRFGFRV
jgi:hypothetical protein